MTPGILLIGHGTRDVTGQQEFLALADHVATLLPNVPVQPCFLELAQPSIPYAVDRLVERGVTQLTAVPLLLFAAGHARQDIPAALLAASAAHAGVSFQQTEPLGCEPALVQLSALRYAESLAAQTARPAAETFLLLVGRGSRDALAGAEMARFARLRWEATPVAWCVPCFAAMTGPTLAAGLMLAARSGVPRIVVQPHLLFAGELARQIAAQTAEFAAQNRHQEVISVPHLGPHSLLAQAIVERCGTIAPQN